jgi:hypothetical protein
MAGLAGSALVFSLLVGLTVSDVGHVIKPTQVSRHEACESCHLEDCESPPLCVAGSSRVSQPSAFSKTKNISFSLKTLYPTTTLA